jgi:hypothetical protein
MELVSQEWFEQLVGECQSILTEFGFISNLNRVRMYHELGKRILEDNSNFERSEIYGEYVTARVAESLNIGERTVQYAIAFAIKYPAIDWDSAELGGLPHGKAITWTKVVHELLPEGEKKVKEEKRCPNCGFLLT